MQQYVQVIALWWNILNTVTFGFHTLSLTVQNLHRTLLLRTLLRHPPPKVHSLTFGLPALKGVHE
jgi:hypothetical protein